MFLLYRNIGSKNEEPETSLHSLIIQYRLFRTVNYRLYHSCYLFLFICDGSRIPKGVIITIHFSAAAHASSSSRVSRGTRRFTERVFGLAQNRDYCQSSRRAAPGPGDLPHSGAVCATNPSSAVKDGVCLHLFKGSEELLRLHI